MNGVWQITDMYISQAINCYYSLRWEGVLSLIMRLSILPFICLTYNSYIIIISIILELIDYKVNQIEVKPLHIKVLIESDFMIIIKVFLSS